MIDKISDFDEISEKFGEAIAEAASMLVDRLTIADIMAECEKINEAAKPQKGREAFRDFVERKQGRRAK